MRDAGPLRPFLDAGVVVLDGGLATELERRGADLRDPLWSAKVLLESPEAIVEVHRAYFDAGADVAITASYQASEQGFAARGVDAATATTSLRLSVELATRARDSWLGMPTSAGHARPRPLVAASIGPYGAMLADGSEYRGDYGVSRDVLRAFHEARLETLIEANPDLLAIETIPSMVEIEAVIDALTDLADAIPAWFSFTVRDGAHLADGGSLEEAVGLVAESGSAAAVGVNCSAPTAALDAVENIASITPIPVIAYPNRGADWDATAKAWTGGADVDMASVARSLVEAGAGLVGGCCGTGPEDVRSIALAVGARTSSPPG